MADSNIIWIASFDIGKKNFAFYIEELDITELKLINNLPKSEKIFKKVVKLHHFLKLLSKIYIK